MPVQLSRVLSQSSRTMNVTVLMPACGTRSGVRLPNCLANAGEIAQSHGTSGERPADGARTDAGS